MQEIKPIQAPNTSGAVSRSPAELGCQITDGYWDPVENKCKNLVTANQNVMSGVLAQPTQEENAPNSL